MAIGLWWDGAAIADVDVATTVAAATMGTPIKNDRREWITFFPPAFEARPGSPPSDAFPISRRG
ncbi:hypothetical protein GCM10009608_87690 [Pseudonocardia alaniniphila]